MSWDLEVELVNKPGTIAELGEAGGAAGWNISGIGGVPGHGVGVMQVLADGLDGAAGVAPRPGGRQAGNRDRLASQRLPPLLDLEVALASQWTAAGLAAIITLT